jgi:hypothetical protein
MSLEHFACDLCVPGFIRANQPKNLQLVKEKKSAHAGQQQ